MSRRKTWCGVLVGGMLVAAALHAEAGAGQAAADVQPSAPTYAIPLRDGSTAVVWWDTVSDPAHPGWRCDVPALRGGGTGRFTTALTAAPGDWRAALAEARAILKGRVADSD